MRRDVTLSITHLVEIMLWEKFWVVHMEVPRQKDYMDNEELKESIRDLIRREGDSTKFEFLKFK